MKINFNQLDRGYKKYKDLYQETAINVLNSGWYVLGKEVEKFEEYFARFIESKNCVGLNSGLDALILAFRALGVAEGDEVIVPANTYIASVIGITENGATPIFVEPDEYYNINADMIEKKITDKTKAILAVHLYGQAANMKKIKDISIKYNLYLVEDCAQSHGASFNGKITGSFGDVGCFSFFPTKNLGAFGDGGAIITNDDVIAEKLRMLRNYGSKIKYYHEIEGINSRLDEIQAALLSVKLSHIEELNSERQTIAKEYLSRINNPWIVLPKQHPRSTHVWHLFVIKCLQRNVLQKFLLSKGINTQIHYPIPPHLSVAYRWLGYKVGDFPITENYSNTILSLPLFNGMEKAEIDYVIKTINDFRGEEQ